MSYHSANGGVKPAVAQSRSPRLVDEIRARLRLKHYSFRTEQAYIGWVRRYILASGKRHPRDMG
ncbi:MAG TPA: phage integrase N-terminal SAM-like domain-containing protein, partial [Rhodanobacteraceae bacterium]|nr:phage integrase N-terminal SAM-like domain-containing protein [Rhodanobacteraceae bacterium]